MKTNLVQMENLQKQRMQLYQLYREGQITLKQYLKSVRPLDNQVGNIEISILLRNPASGKAS